MYGQNHSDETRKKIAGAQPTSQVIEVFDQENITTTNYDSMHSAGRALDIRWTAMKNYLANNQQKPYKGRYTFFLKKVN